MLSISVVTPTYYRYKEVPGMLEYLANQEYLPTEVILVDGAPLDEVRTEEWVKAHVNDYPFAIKYYRKMGGTAIQRNYGIKQATGDLIAFIDDDVRVSPPFLAEIEKHFAADTAGEIGGITGFKASHEFRMEDRARWRWYKRLGLLSTFQPSAYDTKCGYPINASMQPAFSGLRPVDIMTSACTVYRREVFTEHGLNFHRFFQEYGMLEDSHLALSVQKKGYVNRQCGDALCDELNSSSGRSNQYIIGFKTCVNYYYVFNSICGPLTFKQRLFFFRYQLFELCRFFLAFMKKQDRNAWAHFTGKLNGIAVALFSWDSYLKKILS